jgi:hypothetical protein
MQRDNDFMTIASERLVDTVVDDLPYAVHQATGVGGPDIHPGPLPDSVQSLENQQVTGVVRRIDGGDATGHGSPQTA